MLLGLWRRQALALAPQLTRWVSSPPHSPVMDQIENFHTELLYIITAVCLFVLALLIYIMFKFRAGANPTPCKVHHNTLLEVAWTIIPVIILVVIAVPVLPAALFRSDHSQGRCHDQGDRQAVVLDL